MKMAAFAGRNTTGITIDGKQYHFSGEPVNISWGLLDDPIRDPSVNCAYVFRCDTPGKVTLPFAGEGFQCCVCRNYMLDCGEAYPFATCYGQVVIDVTPSVAGQWLVFYTVAVSTSPLKQSPKQQVMQQDRITRM